MKNKIISAIAVLFMSAPFWGCEKYPVDEDGLLITTRQECYVSSFDMLGLDHQTVVQSGTNAVVDTTECTINVTVKFGTNLKSLWPRFSLCEDAKLDPKVTGWTDFSDMDNPRRYTVISGNRKIRKTYSIYVNVATPQ